MGELRSDMPPISSVTVGEFVVILYILFSIFPIFTIIFEYEENISERERLRRITDDFLCYIIGFAIVLMNVILVILYYR